MLSRLASVLDMLEIVLVDERLQHLVAWRDGMVRCLFRRVNLLQHQEHRPVVGAEYVLT